MDLAEKISDSRMQFERRRGRQAQVKETIEQTNGRIVEFRSRAEDLKEAQDILQIVAQATQQELEYHVSELVSLALEAVFPNPYKLNLDFELRRNKSEADLTFSKDGGEKIDPLSASGGGAVDVAAFALRISLWSLRHPRSRACLILDEPFRFLSTGLQSRASAMLAEISTRLGIQFIIVTHEDALIEEADRIFMVTQKNGVSEVKQEAK